MKMGQQIAKGLVLKELKERLFEKGLGVKELRPV